MRVNTPTNDGLQRKSGALGSLAVGAEEEEHGRSVITAIEGREWQTFRVHCRASIDEHGRGKLLLKWAYVVASIRDVNDRWLWLSVRVASPQWQSATLRWYGLCNHHEMAVCNSNVARIAKIGNPSAGHG
jgi:hypothetical protein